MCPPDLYEVDYVINPWMEGQVHKASRHVAELQWRALFDLLEPLANIHLIAPAEGSPDMVFTANAGLEREGKVVVSSFAFQQRQAEENHFARWFGEGGFAVTQAPRDTPFEGEGDALFSTDGQLLFVGQGPRSGSAILPLLRSTWNIEVCPLTLVDPRFYHLDTCFAPLPKGELLWFPEAFDRVTRDRVELAFEPEKRIAVSTEDALRFACNAVTIGETIILNRISAALEADLTARGYRVLQTELSEFLKAGGAAKCLVMKLSRAPVRA